MICLGLHEVEIFFPSAGIDDMFVIMQSWNNLAEDEKSISLEDRFGMTMQHAGVAITITSLTDFLAFAIGATTVQHQ